MRSMHSLKHPSFTECAESVCPPSLKSDATEVQEDIFAAKSIRLAGWQLLYYIVSQVFDMRV